MCLTVQRSLSTSDWTAEQLPHCTGLLSKRAELEVPETVALPESMHLSQGCRRALPGCFWNGVSKLDIKKNKMSGAMDFYYFKGKVKDTMVVFFLQHLLP